MDVGFWGLSHVILKVVAQVVIVVREGSYVTE